MLQPYYENEHGKLYCGDCLEIMPQLIVDGVKVDMVLCDLPYGVTACKWDAVIPFAPLWATYGDIVKEDGAIVLFSAGMFTADLMCSNRDAWRYNLVWKNGNRTTGFLDANRKPMRNHEDVCVFYKAQPTYNPQMTVGAECHKRNATGEKQRINSCYGNWKMLPTVITNQKYPISIVEFGTDFPQIYPTQKPVDLCRWLIKTYTNDGDSVLDNCAGSGSILLAAQSTGRRFIGIDSSDAACEIARKRLEGTIRQIEGQITMFGDTSR